MSDAAPRYRFDLPLLMAGFAILYALNAHRMVFMDPDEARCVLIARDMLTSGDWLVPRTPLGDGEYFDKPILYFSMLAGTFRLLGVNEFAARLLSALGGGLVVGATYCLGRIIVSRRAGLAAACMLGTSVMMIVGARFVRMDIWLTAFASWAVVFWARVHFEQAPRRCLWYGYASLAAALLTKGLVGIFLPLAAIGGYVLLQRDWRALRQARLPAGLGLLFLLAAPWYIYMELAFPGYLVEFFWRQHFLRASTDTFGRSESVLYLPVVALGAMMPWTFLLIAGIFRSLPLARNRDWPRPAGMGIVYAWAVIGVVPFALSHTQLPVYIMPAFPALALIAGWALDQILRRDQHWELRLTTVVTVTTMALALVALAIINRCTFDIAPWWTLARRLAGFGIFALILVALLRRRRFQAIVTTVLGGALAMTVEAAYVEGVGLFREFSSQTFVRAVIDNSEDADLLAIGPAPKYALPLYLDHRLPVKYLAHVIEFAEYVDHPRPSIVLMTDRGLYERARGQMAGRMRLLQAHRDSFLVRIEPKSAPPGPHPPPDSQLEK